jgi:hypothetical protein
MDDTSERPQKWSGEAFWCCLLCRLVCITGCLLDRHLAILQSLHLSSSNQVVLVSTVVYVERGHLNK